MPKQRLPENYLARAQVTHRNRYSYDISTFRRLKDPVVITCPAHGTFSQQLGNHLSGAGCPQCAGRNVDWVERFRSVHRNLYDYSRVVYAGYQDNVEIICGVHGSFFQTPDNHYRGRQGCPSCKGARIRASKQLPIEEFIRRATAVHDGRYIYNSAQFINVLTGVVSIVCPIHGEFQQSPVNHLAGKVGCVKCNHMKSKGEAAVTSYLAMFTPVISRDRKLIAPKELDIYLPEKKLAIEYCGMYWHSFGDATSELKGKHGHFNKHEACKEQNVRLITVFESEWIERSMAIRRLLRNAVGKAKGKLMARKCHLGKPTTQEATAFYERYHPQGGAGSGDHYGLYWRGKLVACMRFSFGSNDRGTGAKNRVWTLARYATRVNVVGGASRLFKAFVDEHKPLQVKSFSDNRYFDGGMYSALGFNLNKETAPDYQVWSKKIGMRPKSHYQRGDLQKRLDEHGIDEVFDAGTDTRTEAEMTYRMGARRIYDCGKKRWVWVAP